MVRPEQSYPVGPSPPKMYGLPSWARAYEIAVSTTLPFGAAGAAGAPPPPPPLLGAEPPPDGLAALREAAGRSRYGASVGDSGRLALEPVGSGFEPLEARLLLAVERVQALGEWSRLKACPASDCQWAFFDSSRNRSRTWCSMDVCGNRAKTRRYRRRKDAS